MISSVTAVFLKDIRQYFRSSSGIGLLVFCLLPWLIYALKISYAANSRDTGAIFGLALSALFLGGIVMAFLCSSRLCRESGNPALDPALTTPLSPWAIIAGKTLSCFAMIGVLFGVALPVLFLTAPEKYGGAEVLQAVVLVLLELFAVLQLMFSARPKSGFRKRSNTAGIILLCILLPSVLGFLISGVNGEFMQKSMFWSFALCIAALGAVFFVGAVAQLMPRVCDRTFAVKTLLLCCVAGLVPVLHGLTGTAMTPAKGYSLGLELLAVVFLIFAPFEKLTLSRRSLAEEEANVFYKLAFPLQGTAAGCFAGSLLCFAAGWLFDPARRFIVYQNFAEISTDASCFSGEYRVATYGLLFFYSTLIVFLRIRARNQVRPMSPAGIACLTLLPGILLGIFSFDGVSPILKMFSPLCFLTPERFSPPLAVAFAVAGIVFALFAFRCRFDEKTV